MVLFRLVFYNMLDTFRIFNSYFFNLPETVSKTLRSKFMSPFFTVHFFGNSIL